MPIFAQLAAVLFGCLATVGTFVVIRGAIVGWRRRVTATAPALAEERLLRIEQAIESVTLEMERVSEAQRFTTQLLLDRLPVRAAEQLPSRTVARAPGTVTPH